MLAFKATCLHKGPDRALTAFILNPVPPSKVSGNHLKPNCSKQEKEKDREKEKEKEVGLGPPCKLLPESPLSNTRVGIQYVHGSQCFPL